MQIAVGGYDKNFSYLIYDEDSNHAVIVDPSGDTDAILSSLEELRLDLVGILVTHTHHDHIDKLDEILQSYSVPVYVHEMGLHKIMSQSPVYKVRNRETLLLGSNQITVLYTPGHSEDSVCFYIDSENSAGGIPKVLSGDTLFVEGCGRTDKNNVQSLYNSLICLKALPDETEVYPGHDYGSKAVSTIGFEKEHNKYMIAKDFDTFKKIRLS